MAKAVIFDMNGVIINDERIHQESWKEFCKKRDLHLTEEEFKHNVFGRIEKEIFEYLFKRKISEPELDDFSNERVDTAIAIFKPQLKMTDGLGKLLSDLKNKNIAMAIATSSRLRYTDFILDGLDIRKYFSVVITSHDITNGKPDPEIYLKTAQKLQVSPGDCVVFEDTISGIKSAQAAEMKVIAIASTHTKEELGIADKVVENFDEVTFEILSNI